MSAWERNKNRSMYRNLSKIKMVQVSDKRSPARSAHKRRVEGRRQDQFGLLERIPVTVLGEAFQQRVVYTCLPPPGRLALQWFPGGGLHPRSQGILYALQSAPWKLGARCGCVIRAHLKDLKGLVH